MKDLDENPLDVNFTAAVGFFLTLYVIMCIVEITNTDPFSNNLSPIVAGHVVDGHHRKKNTWHGLAHVSCAGDCMDSD